MAANPYRQQPHPPPEVAYPPPYTGAPSCPQPHGDPHSPSTATNSRKAFFRGLGITIIILVAAGGISTFIIFAFILRPETPYIAVESFAVSALNAADSSISGEWDVGLTVRNRDQRLHAYYQALEVRILYKSHLIGSTSIPEFNQAEFGRDSKSAKVTAKSSQLDAGMVRDINSERSKGSVTFDIEVKAVASYKFSRLLKGGRWIFRYDCDDLAVGIGSDSANGKMSDGHKTCSFKHKKKNGKWVDEE